MSEIKRLTIPRSERIDDTPLEACKHCIRGLGVDYPPCGECKHMNKALDKLTEVEDALEREGKEPCEYCDGVPSRYKNICVTELFHQIAADEIYNIDIKVNYCPHCGRKLGG